MLPIDLRDGTARSTPLDVAARRTPSMASSSAPAVHAEQMARLAAHDGRQRVKARRPRLRSFDDEVFRLQSCARATSVSANVHRRSPRQSARSTRVRSMSRFGIASTATLLCDSGNSRASALITSVTPDPCGTCHDDVSTLGHGLRQVARGFFAQPAGFGELVRGIAKALIRSSTTSSCATRGAWRMVTRGPKG